MFMKFMAKPRKAERRGKKKWKNLHMRKNKNMKKKNWQTEQEME